MKQINVEIKGLSPLLQAKHPSPDEEAEIAKRVGMGYTLKDATWAVMGPIRVAKKAAQKQEKVQKQTQMKKRANVENGNSVSTPPPAPSGDSDTAHFVDQYLSGKL